jgi:hypothetical protein
VRQQTLFERVYTGNYVGVKRFRIVEIRSCDTKLKDERVDGLLTGNLGTIDNEQLVRVKIAQTCDIGHQEAARDHHDSTLEARSV